MRHGLARLVLLLLTVVLASGCAPALDTLVGGDLAVVGPDVVVVGQRATFALLGSAVLDLRPIEWSVDGRVIPATGARLDVVFERPGTVVVAAQANGPTGVRVKFRQVTIQLPLRTSGTPDVVVFAFSGRCGYPCHPDDNRDRWEIEHRHALIRALTNAGEDLIVEFRTYRAHVHDRTGFGRGFLSTLEDLDHAQRTLVDGVANPTRFVLLGHSHGTQFAHLLAHERPNVRFTASVLLDSVCLLWDVDHATSFVHALRTPAGMRPGTEPYEVACKNQQVPGRGFLDIGDAVPPNVAHSFEVRSGGTIYLAVTGLVRDATPNGRTDGSQRGLEHVEVLWEGHEEVAAADSFGYESAVRWLAGVLSSP